ncbi:hypothetical protein [Marimonas lutisalis]|uniref:hypothetical protein n=1 Tax=Marimonas lutisalis TaxID=2545756 RepID=UPI0010FA3C68|nr:hypothetical protein [Marimonas lutisalis]
MTQDTREDYVLSFYRVRQALGVLGLAFPFMLIVGGLLADARIHPSISDYYHTTLRDLYVGTLFAIGIFLVSYKGHARTPGEPLSDNLAATLAGIGAFGLALFPNHESEFVTFSQQALGAQWATVMHFSSAILFLGAMAYFALGKFARTENPHRRRIYRACGWMILTFGVLATIASVFRAIGSEPVQRMIVESGMILWFEACGIWAFGVSWLVKGKADIAVLRRLRGAAGG